jgi:hypothetical protein
VGVIDLFTNRDKKEESDVDSPAFSLTKVQAGIGALIVAILGAVPPALKADETVVVAAIAAGVVVMLGVFALAGVDVTTRQRAAEAKLRYGGGSGGKGSGGTDGGSFFAVPKTNDLVIQVGSSSDEYRLAFARVEGDTVTLHATGHGKPMVEVLQQPPSR